MCADFCLCAVCLVWNFKYKKSCRPAALKIFGILPTFFCLSLFCFSGAHKTGCWDAIGYIFQHFSLSAEETNAFKWKRSVDASQIFAIMSFFFCSNGCLWSATGGLLAVMVSGFEVSPNSVPFSNRRPHKCVLSNRTITHLIKWSKVSLTHDSSTKTAF